MTDPTGTVPPLSPEEEPISAETIDVGRVEVTRLDVREYRKTATVRAGRAMRAGTIPTLEGDHSFSEGDYIAGPGAGGEFWPVKRDIFERTYATLDAARTPRETPDLEPLLTITHEEDDSISVQINALPGHIGAAMTFPEAVAEAHDAALAWVATLRDTPRETPDLDDGHEHVTIRIDKRARQELRARLFEADMRGVGYADFILAAVKRSREAPRETPDPYIAADIWQAASGGPDFTVKEWPETPAGAVARYAFPDNQPEEFVRGWLAAFTLLETDDPSIRGRLHPFDRETPDLDAVATALQDVRCFVAEMEAKEGAGLHYAVSPVRILDYIDMQLATLGDRFR